MEIKTPMVFVKHIAAAQRGNAASIQYLCDHTSGQFVKICREYGLSNSEIETVLAKAYGLIFDDIRSVKNPQKFMGWASDLVHECCKEIAAGKAQDEKADTEVTKAGHDETPAHAEETGASCGNADTAVDDVSDSAKEGADLAVAAPAGAGIVDATVAEAGIAGAAPAGAGIADATVAEAGMAGATLAGAGLTATSVPKAFYDDNAYVEPTQTFEEELTYADDTPAEPLPEDKRIIPVDELVYRPYTDFRDREEPESDLPLTETIETESPETSPSEALLSEAAVTETTPSETTFSEAALSETTSSEQLLSETTPSGMAPVETASFETTSYEALSSEAAPLVNPSSVTPVAEPPVHDADEPDIDLIEREENTTADTIADADDIDVDRSDNDDEDEEDGDEDEIQSGLAFRTKVLIGLLCVFIFGACVGIGYAISKGMTSDNTPDSLTESYAESQTPTPEASVTETPAQSSVVSAASVESAAEPVESSSHSEVPESKAVAEPTPGETTGSDYSETVLPAGEVTARADLGTYLGETFASVFRDYPDLPRSVYRGTLSYANSFIGFIGSYDATQPVSSTIVESVSLLSKAENFNINGFYVGMSSADAEALANSGGYTEQELTAESSREYIDAQGNILTLTIDNGVIKNVTLRIKTADDVTMQTADSVPEETTAG